MYYRKCASRKARLLYWIGGFGNIIDGLIGVITIGYISSGFGLMCFENAMVTEIKFAKKNIGL